ncbi:dysbindin-like [Cottoperca gobio]|uniref:Dysbindin-like n=1 Tax=Cottoperca gobio TaxID=56716 RepID=A0A6J2PU82_COTGO|nr:dysbindin-like [Cottoperca gobio]
MANGDYTKFTRSAPPSSLSLVSWSATKTQTCSRLIQVAQGPLRQIEAAKEGEQQRWQPASVTLEQRRNMSSSSANLHNKRLPSETERGQRLPDVDVAQQVKLRERQRFFEEVFQHDVDVYLSSAHLCIRDYKRPPIGSVSSMEVNVDLLDQMELIDISDQEALDVFFSSGGEEGVLASPLPVQGNNNNGDVISNGLFRHVLEGLDAKSRMSSTSSISSSDSQTTDANRGDTPVVRSEDEGTHTSTVKRRGVPAEKEKVKSQTPSSSS